MRDIKFRGKVADEPNEWVYGYLVRQDTIFQEKEHKNSKCCGLGMFGIDKNTVGQYTGVKDKNGTEIYEGDIVRIYSSYYDEEDFFVIKYTDDEARYEIISNELCIDFDNVYSYELEVIGNIYDNPELLEVKDE